MALKEGFPLSVSVSNNQYSNWGKLCDGGGSGVINKYQQFAFGSNGEIQLCHDTFSDNPEEVPTVWHYTTILPNYVQPDENNRTHEDLLFKTEDNNFQDQPTDVSGVKWRYSFDDNIVFKDFPEEIKHQFPLKATVGEILAGEPNTNSIQNLRVKIEMDIPNNLTPDLETEMLLFSIESSSPQLLDLTPHKTSCVGAGDGSFNMTMDRDLEDGEKLVVSVYNSNNDTELLYQDNTTILIDNEDATFSFVWDEPLPEGSYIVKYQTKNNGDGILPWDSLEPTDPFSILPPPEVTFSLQELNDVYCHGGSDGRFKITASGGSEEGNYQYRINNEGGWMDFDNTDTHILSGLEEGDYTVAVQRVKGDVICASNEEDDHIYIGQPSKALLIGEITDDNFVEPTAFGFTDGSITVDISGGTPYQNNSYDYTWYDEDDNLITTTSAQYVSNVYPITLENVTAGTYTLNISDANYSEADDIQGCILTQDFELIGPPKLQLTVEETTPISCNSANIYSNPSNDGELTILATGGVPFDPLIDGQYAYIYTWKKKVGPNNWQNIPNNGSNVLSNLEAGEFAVNIEDAHGIVIGTYVNNTLQQTNDVVYVLEEPELLTVQIEKTDINCFGGTDGTATAVVNGGTPPFEYFWSTGATSETAEGLWLGNHTIYVMDSRGCEAEAEVTIGQPDAPVSISNPQYVQPTAFGFTNGSITVQINGGTPLNNDSYNYEWRDAQNNIINTTFAEAIPDGYAIQAHDIPAGIYTLTVTDANYDNATQKEGCTYVAEFILDEPPALELSVEQTIPISCNGENLFNNPSDDGQLMAIASGGVPFDPLINGQFAYIYTWKKKDDQNIRQTIPNVTGNILDNVDAGEYAVNIEDSNGIILGVYVNNMLEEPTDYEYPVQETDPIVLQMDKLDVSCYNGNDGWATVAIEGGMPPYNISWSSGADTEIAENLIAGTYFVYVMDFYGCEVSATVTIDQPEELTVSVIDIVSPTCFESEDGSLEVEILGGIPPYTYLWNVDEASLSLNNIGQGAYNLEVMDATGCTVSKEIILEAPFPTQVDLGENRTLCNGQEHTSDITINDPNAEYQWTSDNGFSTNSPKVTLSKPGIYTATVTNSLGCSGSDTIEITTTQIDIDSQFLITSQAFAGEDVVLVNTSNPIGTNEEWFFPVGMKVIEQKKGTVIVRFEEPGAYEVILRNYQGDCYQDITKSIIVAEAREHPDVGEAVTPFIKEFKVFPNPSSGTFTVVVSLQEASSASLRLFGLATNHIYDEQQLQDSAYYQVPYAMDLASGVYLLLLETAKGSEIRKIVIL
ncbi:MAG: T9SS type A sorting domain-containing protein [Algicola sp.]|nr:T9SS type A sorting domain-containing protein [Algicola sp.]